MKLTTKSALHENLGHYLREKRETAGFTQAEIARKLGYSSPQFTLQPTAEKLESFGEALQS